MVRPGSFAQVGKVQDSLLDEWVADRLRRSLRGRPHGLVTTDVFETLLIGRVSSSLRSRLECAGLIARWPADRVPPLDWLTARRCDWEARRQPESVSGRSEWSLRDWADELAVQTNCSASALYPVIRSVWLSVNRRTHRPNHALWQVLESHRARGGRVAAVSDTWADSEALTELLAAHGIRVDSVYSSSETGLSKVAGGLHGYVVQAESSLAAEGHVVHVGDDLRADVLRAREAGLRPLWTPRQLPLERRIRRALGQSSSGGLVEAFRSVVPADVSTVESTVASVLLPALLCLHEATRRLREQHGSEAVLYIARDAWLMHRVQQAAELHRPLGAPARWIRLSRRVVTLSHPVDLLDTLSGVAGRKGKETVGRLLRPFSLGSDLEARILLAAGLSEGSATDPRSRRLLSGAMRELVTEIDEERRRQRELLRSYVEPMVAGARSAMVVDSGWVGTSQDTLGAVFPEWSAVGGVYLGVSHPHPLGDRYWRWGLLRDDQPGVGYGRSVDRLASTLRIWEVMLREPSGSVATLERLATGEVVPRLQAVDEDSPEVQLGRRVGRALDAALDRVGDQLGAWLVLASELPLGELRHAAAAFSAPFVYTPGASLARDVLAAGYDEAAGHRRSLASLAQDPRDVWWPGVLASGLGRGGRG